MDETTAHGMMCPLVEFTWAGNTTRYAGWDADLTISGDVFQSEPSLEYEFVEPLAAGAKDSPVAILMALRAPLDTVTSPFAHARVDVTVWDCDPSDLTRILVFSGKITKAVNAPGQRKGLGRVEVSGHRVEVQYPVGLPMMASCPWSLGDTTCCVDLTTYRQTRTIASVTGRTLVVTGLTSPSSTYWLGGVISALGISIPIRSVSGTTVIVRDFPPASWVGASAVLTPGCDKSIVTCRDRFANEQRFGGIGIKAPLRNPLFETDDA